MHLSIEEIRKFIENKLQSEELNKVNFHLENCEFCSDLLEKQKLMNEAISESFAQPLPDNFDSEMQKLWQLQSGNSNIIFLNKSIVSAEISITGLAADGTDAGGEVIQNLATVYSENPEVVLRVMREMNIAKDYIQIISEDPKLSNHVMVRLPDLDWEVMTDDSGKAVIGDLADKNYESLNWQIKLPDAVFELEPIKNLSIKKEIEKQFELRTDNNDKIKVKLTGKEDSLQIQIQVEQLNGKTDFGEIKVSICQKEEIIIRQIDGNNIATFDYHNDNDSINIRLFQ